LNGYLTSHHIAHIQLGVTGTQKLGVLLVVVTTEVLIVGSINAKPITARRATSPIINIVLALIETLYLN